MQKEVTSNTFTKQDFKELCDKIANVPWEIEGSQSYMIAKCDRSQIHFHGHLKDYKYNTLNMFNCNVDPHNDALRIVFQDSVSPAQIAISRAFLGAIELEYIAHEIAPSAPWAFGENYAKTCGIVIWRPTWREPWKMGVGSSWIRASSASDLISIYREHRIKHDAARGVKNKKGKQELKELSQFAIFDPENVILFDVAEGVGFYVKREEFQNKHNMIPVGKFLLPIEDLTTERARNILACIASPQRFTRLAAWARWSTQFPFGGLALLIKRALEQPKFEAFATEAQTESTEG